MAQPNRSKFRGIRTPLDSGYFLGRTVKGRGDVHPIPFVDGAKAIAPYLPPNVTFGTPTALLGLTAIPGTAKTAMRSDAAPALDQGIIPTWTGLHTFNAQLKLANGSAVAPELAFNTNYGFFYDAAHSAIGYSVNGKQMGYFSDPNITIDAGPGHNPQFVITAEDDPAGVRAIGGFGATLYRTGAQSPNNSLSHARGTRAAPTVIAGGDRLGRITYNGYGGTAFQNAAFLDVTSAETTPTDAHMGGRFVFSTSPLSSVTPAENVRFDNATGISMYGANPVIDKDRLHILRGFATGSLIAAPATGAAALDTTLTIPKFYNGAAWVPFVVGANPTATAKDTAVNGSALTFMRSDAAPAIQKADSSQFGIVKVDGTTIVASGGVISAAGGTPVINYMLSNASSGSGFANSGTSFATKGNTIQTGKNPITIYEVEVPIQTLTSGSSVTCEIFPINTAGTLVTGVAVATKNITATGGSTMVFTFGTPPVLAANSSYAILIEYTGAAGGTSILNIFSGTSTQVPHFPNLGTVANANVSAGASLTKAATTIANGDSLTPTSPGAYAMSVKASL